MRRRRNVKIVATLGPKSGLQRTVRGLFEAGVDVFRLNLSHGRHDEHARHHGLVRRAERHFGRPIGIVLDLQGPKLRIGAMDGGGAELKAGARFRLDLDPAPGDGRRAPLPHAEVFAALGPGTDILLDDGRIRLRARKVGRDFAECRVMAGGGLSPGKGVNVPGAVLPLSAITAKDRADLRFAIGLGVEWVALSFVQRAEDIVAARKLVKGRAAIMAKIERPAAVEDLDRIIELSDAIMVARGDLGVELPIEVVPGLQKRIVRAARVAGKPVIVATQMLESMVRAPVPTRAEVSDVATAVYDGADAVMLSAESAVGAYPVESAAMMDRIVRQAEHDPLYASITAAQHQTPEATAADAITRAARQVAETIGARCVATYTTSGSTCLRASRERPRVPILGLTPVAETARRLALAWGVHSVFTEDAKDFGDMVGRACEIARAEGMARARERIVITAGVPFGTPGATNVLRIATLDVAKHKKRARGARSL